MALFDFVQEAHSDATSSSTSVTLTLTAGNLVVFFGFQQGGSTFTVSDGVNTWVRPLGAGLDTAMYYALNVAGGSTTITLASTGATRCDMSVMELVGSSSVAYDTGNQTVYPFPGSYASLASGSITTASAVEGLVGCCYFNVTTGALTEASGFTARVSWTDSTSINGNHMATQTTSASGSYQYAPTANSGNNFAFSGILAFNTGGPPPSGSLFRAANLSGLQGGGPFFVNPLG